MRRTALLLALALAGVAGAGGGGKHPPRDCPPGTPTIDLGGIERRLNAAEALWRSRGSGTYRLNVLALGQLSLAVEVEVRPGLPPRGLQRPVTPGRVVTPGELGGAARYTVSGLFAQVRTLLREQIEARPWNPSPRPCGALAVSFDPHDGHLRSLKYDSAFSIDEEYTLTVGPVLPPR